ncbi:MAG: hypothetical protein DRI44_05195 [Chlamydiae bacterium]|nr:MAG: hypothetical protein DRI44_05195 [Chlamydiota bacterium]
MKKFIILSIVCACFAGSALAGEKAKVVKKELKLDDESIPIQFAFFPGVPQATKYSRVHGVKFGFPISSGYGVVNGMEASIFGSWTKYFAGLQGAIYCECKEGVGLQGAIYSQCDDGVGMQGSVVNISKNFQGVDAAVVNVNTGGKGKFTFIGMQFGLVNYCDSLNGMQFGLVNIIQNSPHSFIPFVNFNFPDED